MQLILTKGLPASGKTTWYKGWENENNVVITKDDLRKEFPTFKEKQIIFVRDERTIEALKQGKNVCWCDTNYNPIHEHRAYEISRMFTNVELFLHHFNERPEVCIERDLKRETGRVGSQVIWKMYYQYVLKKPSVYYVAGRDTAIICDIDGTLAQMSPFRKPFDWDKVMEDEVRHHIKMLVNRYYQTGVKIILVSGRDAVCEKLTKMWLEKNGINYHHLLMRPMEDKRDDREVKAEIYELFIKNKYNIELVLDDRPKMIRMWLEMGLPIVNVQGHTDFEF